MLPTIDSIALSSVPKEDGKRSLCNAFIRSFQDMVLGPVNHAAFPQQEIRPGKIFRLSHVPFGRMSSTVPPPSV